MSNDNDDIKWAKTIIMGILIFFGMIFLFCYKTESCKSDPKVCHDEFIEYGTRNTATCDPGAIMEAVATPKPGVICHCVNHNYPADAGN